MRLEWTDPALYDLAGIRDHIRLDSPDNARRFVARIFDTTEKQLTDFPKIGRPVPEARVAPEDVRELLFRDYRIIYWLKTEHHIQVLAVVHGSRDLAGADNKPW